jgi:hypothetical protein
MHRGPGRLVSAVQGRACALSSTASALGDPTEADAGLRVLSRDPTAMTVSAPHFAHRWRLSPNRRPGSTLSTGGTRRWSRAEPVPGQQMGNKRLKMAPESSREKPEKPHE